MKKKRKGAASYEELVKGYYGGPGQAFVEDAARFANLFATYYGKPDPGLTSPAVTLSVRSDDGETLRQKKRRKPVTVRMQSTSWGGSEYVVGQSAGHSDPGYASTGYRPLSTQASTPAARAYAVDPDALVRQECLTDVLDPLNRTAPEYSTPQLPEPAPYTPPRSESRPAPPTDAGASKAASTDDDFIEDMKAILSGQKTYDPESKAVVDKGGSGRGSERSQPTVPPGSEHDIFNRIAQSMQYANAYDLGTVELKNRFDEFERDSQAQRRQPAQKKAARPNGYPPPAATSPSTSTEDFMRDLDAIETRRGGTGSEAVAHQQSAYSRPFFDTGEHVRAGGKLYPGKFKVGQPPGVQFSYGQIIGMAADLFGTVEQMMSASVDELSKIKALVERSTSFYEKKGKTNVTNKEWNDATSGQYLKLAEDNFEHFAPDVLFTGEAFAAGANKRGNNKDAWERHHRRAVEEAQKTVQEAKAAGKPVPFLEWPLIINAFGDHFLTDAFASGHLINKEVMIESFKSMFFQSGALTADGQQFFTDVATEAFQGDVAKKFSALEVADPIVGNLRPDIDSAFMFAQVLIRAATQEPDRIANVAVKALHDVLNEDGIQVNNDAGDGPWTLKGDEHLDPKTLKVMMKAVQQSVDNVNAAAKQTTIDMARCFSLVWRYVPRLTDTSLTKVKALAKEFSDPKSKTLVKAAARIITREVDTLIDALLASGRLRPVQP